MLIEKLKHRCGDDILAAESAFGDESIVVARERAPGAFLKLRDDPDLKFDFLADLTAVDWPERKPRFDVVYHLNSIPLHHRLRVKIQVDESDLWVHTVTPIWKAADWLERECF